MLAFTLSERVFKGTMSTGRFLLQVTFHKSSVQVTVLPINKQAKQCPLALNQAKSSPSVPGDTVQFVYMSTTQ